MHAQYVYTYCACMCVCIAIDYSTHSYVCSVLGVFVLVPAIDHDLEYGEEVATVSVSCA